MSMYKIAKFLKINRAVQGDGDDGRWLSVPRQNFPVRYQLWGGGTEASDLFTTRRYNRSRLFSGPVRP